MSKDKKYSDEYIKKRREWYHLCWQEIRNANYKLATENAALGLKTFPKDLFVEFNYYSILADYALSANSKTFKSMHARAVKGMRNCLRKTRGAKPAYVVVMKNEYYYQTKQFRKQFNLGITAYEKFKDKLDMYSSGVGGANHALKLAKENQMSRARTWAKKSIDAWEIYFEVDKKYYNPYVHYALAKGILGDEKGMMKALKQSSKLCKKPISYREFQEVLSEISQLKKNLTN